MFGFGFSEFITLGIVILVFLNPKDLPVIVKRLGRIYGRVMRQVNGARRTYREFEKELESLAEADGDGDATPRKKSDGKPSQENRSLS